VTTDDPYLPLAFSLASSPGAHAVLAGAGVSKGAGLPSAWDIEVDLVRQIAQRDQATVVIDDDNAEQWYADNYGKKLTYSTVIEEVTNTAHERQALLRKYFESVDEEDGTSKPIPPSAAHRAIARLVEAGIIRVIVTMNFDRLFEQALTERHIQPTIVATEADAEGLGPLRLVQACVIHLHGDYLNPTSMLNTAAELNGYTPHMEGLLRHVLGDYGLIVAGWSVEHDIALREAAKACCTERFTLGWIARGRITDAAHELIDSRVQAHSAVVLKTTADDAFAHLADQVAAIREKQARHPLTVAVAASRIKRHLTQQSPAISAHDMVAEEFNRLNELPEFDLSDYNNHDPDHAQKLRNQVIEATRIPVAAVAVLAYWGDPDTERWWMSNLERLARPTRHSGSTWLINLPLVAASMLFYAAGVAATCAQGFARLARVFEFHGEPINRAGPVPASTMLAPDPSATGLTAAQHYQAVSPTLVEALGLGSDVIDDAWQLFEILRLATELMRDDQFRQDVETCAAATAEGTKNYALAGIAARCHPDGLHLLAVEQVYSAGTGFRWGSPIAERLAAEINRAANLQPLVDGLNGRAGNVGAVVRSEWIELALKAVSQAVGRVAERHPANWPPGGGVLPNEIWLDD
jgi:hypothetical protein